MTFAWTDALAAACPPFRGDGKPIKIKKVDVKKLLAPVPTSLAPLRAPEYRPRASIVTLCETGKGSFADEADALVILGGTGQKGQYKGSITVVSEAEAKKVVEPAVDRWVSEYGIADALEIVCMVGAWKPYDLMSSPAQTAWLARARLRAHLAHHPDHALALARAQKLAPAGLPVCRGKGGSYEILSYLFPDHRPFFQQAVEELARIDGISRYLVASIATEADLRAIAARIGHADLEEHAVVIARSLREGGLGVLAELTGKYQNAGVALALTAYVSPQAAAAMARLVGNKSALKIATVYFTAHPELAKPALEPLVSGDDKALRTAASKLLASLG